MKKLLIAPALFAIHCAAAQPAGDYELKGFFGAGDNIEVSVRRAGDDKSVWLHLGQKQNGLLLEKADAKTGTATLNVNGVRKELRLAGEAPPKPSKNHGQMQWDIMFGSRVGARFLQIERSREFDEAMMSIMLPLEKEILTSHPEYEHADHPGRVDFRKVPHDLEMAHHAERWKQVKSSDNPVIREHERLNRIRTAAYTEANNSPLKPTIVPMEHESIEAATARTELDHERFAAQIADRMLAEDEAKNGSYPKLTLTPLSRKSH